MYIILFFELHKIPKSHECGFLYSQNLKRLIDGKSIVLCYTMSLIREKQVIDEAYKYIHAMPIK